MGTPMQTAQTLIKKGCPLQLNSYTISIGGHFLSILSHDIVRLLTFVNRVVKIKECFIIPRICKAYPYFTTEL